MGLTDIFVERLRLLWDSLRPMRIASALCLLIGLSSPAWAQEAEPAPAPDAVPSAPQTAESVVTEAAKAEIAPPQTEETEKAAPAKTEAAAEAAPGAEPEAAPSDEKRAAAGYVMSEPEFSIRRGFFVAGEFGGVFTLGGYQLDSVQGVAEKRSVSNLTPHVGIFIGYDVVQGEKFVLSLGPKLTVGGVQSGGRPSQDALANADYTGSSDYTMFGANLTAAMAYRLGDRWSVTLKLDGGMALLDPDPSLRAEDPKAGDPKIAGAFGAAVGAEFYTLLTGFTVGIEARFFGVMASELIPGIAIPVSVKYNF